MRMRSLHGLSDFWLAAIIKLREQAWGLGLSRDIHTSAAPEVSEATYPQ